MAVDKLIPRYLNKDNDSRLIQRTEFTDANNIRVTVGDDGNSGVIKNIKSNEAITLGTALPAGFNRVVGTYAFDSTNAVYVFILNSNSDHCIYEYDPAQGSAVQVVRDESLGFRNDDFLTVSGLVYKDEAFLFFTDGRSEPKKVNITKAKAGGYPAGSTLAEKELELAVIKAQAPQPTAVFSTDATKEALSMYSSAFQFAAQYVYRDGEVSALGHYSDLMVAPNTLNEMSRERNFKKLYNKLTITVGSTTTAVEAIRLFVRDGSNPFYLVEEKSHTGSDINFEFYNDKSYSLLDDNETNKSYDAVPKTAKAQVVSGNRLLYGNYTEGFENFPASASITVTYNDIPEHYDIPVDLVSEWGVSNRLKLRFDLSNVPDGVNNGADVSLDFIVGEIAVKHDVNRTHTITFSYGSDVSESVHTEFDIAAFDYGSVIPISAWASRSAFSSSLGTALVGLSKVCAVKTTSNPTAVSGATGEDYNIFYNGTATLEAKAQSYAASATGAPFAGSPVMELDFQLMNYDLNTGIVEDINAGRAVPSASAESSFDNSTADDSLTGGTTSVTKDKTHLYESMGRSTFKSGESHAFGVVYQDKYGRTSGVKELGSVDVEHINGVSRDGKFGPSDVSIQMSSTMPADFDTFFFVYSGGSTYVDYTQYAITEAFFVEGDGDAIHLALRGLQGEEQSYTDGIGAEIKYSYSKGDMLRVVSYVDTGGNTVYPNDIEFEVINLKNYEDASTSPIVITVGSASDISSRKVGDFIIINAEEHLGFSQANVDSSVAADLWGNQCVVEISRDKKPASEKVYYAIGGVMTRAQHTSAHTLTEGNTWAKFRTMIGHEWSTGDTYVVTSTKEMTEYVVLVESKGYSDFSTKEGFFGKGKPYAVIKGEKEENRYSSVTYSEAMASDSSQLLMSSFNNSLANWYDFDTAKGGIYGLSDKADYIITIQEDGVGLAPINKQFLQAGGELISLNNNFLTDAKYFPTVAGINNRGAFVDVEDKTAFFDTARGRVYTVGRDGLQNISDAGMHSHFATEGKVLTDFSDRVIGNNSTYAGSSSVSVRMGYDKRHSELLVSYHTVDVNGEVDVNGYYSVGTNHDFKTSVYNLRSKAWTTLLDLNADGYGSINNKFYHMKVSSADVVWEADKASTYGKYFGVQYNVGMKVVSAANASSTKTYSAISIEGDVAPTAVSLSTKTQTASMGSTAFTEKEDEFYSPLPQAAGNNEYVSVGKVKAIVGTEVEFYNMINRLPFRLGGDIYKLVGSTLTNVSSTAGSVASSKKLNVSSVASIALNDTLVVKADSSVDGDPLRGTFLEVDMTLTNGTTPIEIYGVNVVQESSELHSPEKQ
jgi:hypothetical protein